MSRSRKKNPCIAWCSGSNKSDKKLSSKKMRRLSKKWWKEILPIKNVEIMNNWNFRKDGLAFWHNNLDKKYMRK